MAATVTSRASLKSVFPKLLIRRQHLSVRFAHSQLPLSASFAQASLHSSHSILSRTYLATRKHQSFAAMSNFYTLKAQQPGGKTFDFSELKGKVVLIVNVASACGFTPQYKGLQALYDKYKDRDFTIIGFPCNQFGGQEPGDDAAISEFCTVNHGVTFSLMSKSDVNGDNTNEVFKWLKNEKSGLLGLSRIKWNFEKFLIDKEGNVVNRWASTTTPEFIDAEIAKLV